LPVSNLVEIFANRVYEDKLLVLKTV